MLTEMGRQIRFCNYGSDELRRLGRVAEDMSPGALWFPWRFPARIPPTRPASTLSGDEFGFLIREVDLSRHLTQYVDQQRYWVVDTFRSPVIECARDRLFTDTGVYGADDVWIPREPDFLAWYDRIVRWVRKTHRRRDGFCWEAPRDPTPG